jgi:SpoVK/Ycf46/Vps4 family AAA+-type ATPase
MSSRSGSGEHEASRRMKTELLVQLDGLIRSSNDRVFLLAASNLPWELDMALLRRLEKRILVTLPTPEARMNMLLNNIPPKMCEPDLDYQAFANQLEVSKLLLKDSLVALLLCLADLDMTLGIQWLRYPFSIEGSRHEAVEAPHDVD